MLHRKLTIKKAASRFTMSSGESEVAPGTGKALAQIVNGKLMLASEIRIAKAINDGSVTEEVES